LQLPTAVLSTTARAKARAAKKAPKGKEGAEAMDTDAAPAAAEGAPQEGEGEGEGQEGAEKAPAVEEPSSFALDNPARVVPAQRRFVSFPPAQRFQPVRPAPSGFVVLRDTRPEEGPVEYLFQEDRAAAAAAAAPAAAPAAAAAAPAAQPEGDEPPPPEPFEYVPS
jgi:26S proteasome regulatory subunit N2